MVARSQPSKIIASSALHIGGPGIHFVIIVEVIYIVAILFALLVQPRHAHVIAINNHVIESWVLSRTSTLLHSSCGVWNCDLHSSITLLSNNREDQNRQEEETLPVPMAFFLQPSMSRKGWKVGNAIQEGQSVQRFRRQLVSIPSTTQHCTKLPTR